MTAWPFGVLRSFGYRVILADPPWNFDGGGDRNARTHYDTMTPADIARLPVGDLAAKDCALFLWVTDPLLDVGLAAMKRWGFRYTTVAFTWAKRTRLDAGWHLGTGYYTRANPEMCLLGIAGSLGLPKSRGVRQLVVEPLREHSRKPDRIHGDIEALFDGQYCELFARQRRPGWDAWGNQLDRFADAGTAMPEAA